MTPSESRHVPYDFRACDDADEDAILELLRPTMGERVISRQTREQWRWKHEDNPFGSSYRIAAIDPAAGDLVGLRAMMWWMFVGPGGEVVPAVRAVDTATHPAHQRRGVFSSLTRRALEEVEALGARFVFNTPNENSLPGYLKMGWRVAARWTPYVRPVRFGHGLRSALFRRGRRGGTPAPPTVEGTGLLPWRRFREETAGDFDAVVAAHEESRVRVGLRTRRDPAYLEWRYGAQPHLDYGVYPLRSGRKLEGFLVARPALGTRGLNACVVTEMFLRQPTPSAARALLRAFLRMSPCDYLLASFSRGTIEHRAMRSVGFVPAFGRSFTWAVRPLSIVQTAPTLPGDWDLTLGDMEIF